MTPDALTELFIRVATPADAAPLSAFAKETFVDTFGAQNTAADMAMYVEGAFSEAIQRRELEDSRNTVFLAERSGVLAGYAVLTRGPVPGGYDAMHPVEIDRLYVGKAHIGGGVGAALMQHCLADAEDRGHDVVWLNVWEHNLRAIQFYERWQFERIGTMPYVLGTDLQTDFVMVRRVGAGC